MKHQSTVEMNSVKPLEAAAYAVLPHPPATCSADDTWEQKWTCGGAYARAR